MIYTHVMKKGGQGVQSPADRINMIPGFRGQDTYLFKYAVHRFLWINIHVDPDDASDEINHLAGVVDYAKVKFPDGKYFMVMGDLNADCSYFDEDESSNKLRSGDYVWLIDNEADTNLAKKSCIYDRIFVTLDLMGNIKPVNGEFCCLMQYMA